MVHDIFYYIGQFIGQSYLPWSNLDIFGDNNNIQVRSSINDVPSMYIWSLFIGTWLELLIRHAIPALLWAWPVTYLDSFLQECLAGIIHLTILNQLSFDRKLSSICFLNLKLQLQFRYNLLSCRKQEFVVADLQPLNFRALHVAKK
jgi:hypothetical protein